MAEEIPLIPQIPEGLREAAKRGTLVPFIGAGASRIAGCPGWSEFADGALHQLINSGQFSYADFEQIKHLSPRIKLSLASALQKKHNIPIDFSKILHPTGQIDGLAGKRLFASLSQLGKTFVTTNYDKWLDKELIPTTLSVGTIAQEDHYTPGRPRKNFHKIQDLIPSNLNCDNTVIHLHGSLIDPDGMVMTTRGYMEHYANDRYQENAKNENRVLTFLGHLFKERTVLFVGYGLEELEILEYVILKAHRAPGAPCLEKHYILQGFFSHERVLMQSLRQYYLEQCGIGLIPFSRDLKDWNQLLDVLEKFAKDIPASALIVLQELKEMEDFLDG